MTKELISQIIDIDNLYEAWTEVLKNRGAAGGDFITLERFKRRLELNLLHIAERIETGTYQPGKVRMVTIQTGQKQRQIAIWCVADRVLQRACLKVIEPFFERIFLSCSYGYRPGRSVGDAVRQLLQLRDDGFIWIVDADIRDCFASIDHEILLSLLRLRVVDQNVLDLIAMWLPFGRPRAIRRSEKPVGISLGSVLSPLLCNIYLHKFDVALKRLHLNVIRYADDFVVACNNRDNFTEAMEAVNNVLLSLKLDINMAKSRLTSFENGFTFLGVTFKDRKYWYKIRGIKIEASDMGENFPLHIDWY